MSDREKCAECVHLTKLPPRGLDYPQFICNHPVPYWAQPAELISDPQRMITCPTYKAKGIIK